MATKSDWVRLCLFGVLIALLFIILHYANQELRNSIEIFGLMAKELEKNYLVNQRLLNQTIEYIEKKNNKIIY